MDFRYIVSAIMFILIMLVLAAFALFLIVHGVKYYYMIKEFIEEKRKKAKEHSKKQ